MTKSRIWLTLAMVVVLASCAGSDKEQYASSEPIVVRVNGYGTLADPKERKNERKRLMAMRASKLDAYRSLVERVYGTVIFGNSTVREFAMQGDQFQSYVDSWIRGARVVAVNDMGNGTYETIMELHLESSFRHCLTHTNYFKYNEECRIPFPPGSTDHMRDAPVPPPEPTGSLYYLD